jgi:hypothetical protein
VGGIGISLYIALGVARCIARDIRDGREVVVQGSCTELNGLARDNLIVPLAFDDDGVVVVDDLDDDSDGDISARMIA